MARKSGELTLSLSLARKLIIVDCSQYNEIWEEITVNKESDFMKKMKKYTDSLRKKDTTYGEQMIYIIANRDSITEEINKLADEELRLWDV